MSSSSTNSRSFNHVEGRIENETRQRWVLIDDCPEFRKVMVAYANSLKVELDCYESLVEMVSFAKLKNYDLALIDYNLQSFTGVEIAEYVDIFFPQLPVMLVSSLNLKQTARWPKCIKGFLHKSHCAKAILERAKRVLEDVNFYRQVERRLFPAAIGYS